MSVHEVPERTEKPRTMMIRERRSEGRMVENPMTHIYMKELGYDASSLPRETGQAAEITRMLNDH
jgi:hypothetical protein